MYYALRDWGTERERERERERKREREREREREKFGVVISSANGVIKQHLWY